MLPSSKKEALTCTRNLQLELRTPRGRRLAAAGLAACLVTACVFVLSPSRGVQPSASSSFAPKERVKERVSVCETLPAYADFPETAALAEVLSAKLHCATDEADAGAPTDAFSLCFELDAIVARQPSEGKGSHRQSPSEKRDQLIGRLRKRFDCVARGALAAPPPISAVSVNNPVECEAADGSEEIVAVLVAATTPLPNNNKPRSRGHGADALALGTTEAHGATRPETSSRSVARPLEEPGRTLPLFRVLLPSLARSLSCGLRYVVVVAYEPSEAHDDEWRAETQIWFDERISRPMAQRNVEIWVVFAPHSDPVQTQEKPSKADKKRAGDSFVSLINAAAVRTIDANPNWLLVLFDDACEFRGEWARGLVGVSRARTLPSEPGVVAARSPGGEPAAALLAAAHLQTFEGLLFPSELEQAPRWLARDWLSNVYGSKRSALHEATLVVPGMRHRKPSELKSHESQSRMMKALLERSRLAVFRSFIESHALGALEALRAYSADVFDQGFRSDHSP